MNKFKLAALFVITVMLGIVIAGCSTTSPPTETAGKTDEKQNPTQNIEKRGTKVGNKAPDFELTEVSGEKVSLSSLKGDPAVLVFWSAYCSDCEKEAPHINKLAADFGAKGVKVLGINIGESEARTQGGIKDFAIKYDVARDEGRKITQLYKVLGTPTVIFLDKEGVVQYNGHELPKDYAEKLKALIS